MDEGKVYSERLGAIRDEQFEAVAARFNLGRLIAPAPATSGPFGQNGFVTPRAPRAGGVVGRRGARPWVRVTGGRVPRRGPRGHSPKGGCSPKHLNRHTKAPVPWPMLHDETSEIFGWPYLVMPKMPGHCFNE